MTDILECVNISWNEGDDTYLTQVMSDDIILKTFFEIDGWKDIHTMSKCVALHRDFESGDRGFLFKIVDEQAWVEIYTPEGERVLEERAFMRLALYLFELLIAGANDNHHTIRYEPWWHAFTNYMFQIQEQVLGNE